MVSLVERQNQDGVVLESAAAAVSNSYQTRLDSARPLRAQSQSPHSASGVSHKEMDIVDRSGRSHKR